MGEVRGSRFLLTGAVTRYLRAPDLDRPELADDVRRIVDLLTGDFGYVHVPLGKGSPTLAQLRDGLRGFSKGAERRSDDLVAVYLACHGAILEPGDFVLLPSDIDPGDMVPLAVTPQHLIDWLLRDTSVRRLLLIIDACYSGQGGLEAAQEALRWVNPRGAADRPGVVLVTATHPWQQAQPGVFSRAFERAVASLATGGYAQEDLPLDAVVGVINDDPAKPASQVVACHELGKTGRPPVFLPSPRYRRSLIEADLLEQERARHAEQRDAHLRERFLPATRWFTGRHAALAVLAEWLNTAGASSRAMVVTGNAGSGKTAVLGLAAALSDPDRAPAVPLDGLPDGFKIPDGVIAEAIYAGTMTTDQIRERVAAAAGLRAGTTQELINGLSQRRAGPLVVLIDAVDEAADPELLISGLLRPVMTECGGAVRLLLGTRSHLLTARLLGKPHDGRYLMVDLDSAGYADPASVRAYVRRILLAEDALDSAYRPSGIYRNAPAGVLDAVTEAIGDAAGSSFLVARITATTEATAAVLPDPEDPAWRADLPRRAGPAMRRDLRLRLGGDADKAARLLLPLAYAQGGGLPWENIWPHLVEVLSPGCGYGNDDLIWLRRAAGSYAVEGLADGRSVYRLYHQALAEHLVEGRDQQADQQAITGALVKLVAPRAGGGRAWSVAHPYSRTHLATHAARAGRIDGLLADPAYLLGAARPQLLAGLDSAASPAARSAADAYRRAAPRLRAMPAREHASYLQLAARCAGAPGLADAIESCRPPGTWSAIWASWRPEIPNRTLTAHPRGVLSVAMGELGGRPVVVSGGGDGLVRVSDLASGAALAGPFNICSSAVQSVAVGQLGGRPVAVIASGEGVQVRDLASGAPAGGWLRGRIPYVSSVAVGELKGRLVAVASSGKEIRVWDLARGGAPVGGWSIGSIPYASSVAVGELDGRPIVASGGHGSVLLWDLTTGTPVDGLLKPHGPVRAVAFGELNGRPVLVRGGDNGSIRVWHLTRRAPLGGPFTAHTGAVRAVAVGELAGRPVVVSGGDDGSVRVWDLASGAPAGGPFTGHTGTVRAVAAGELEGRPIVVSGEDHAVRVWDDPATGAPAGDEPSADHAGMVRAVAMGELAGRPVVVCGGDDGSVRVWDLASGAPAGGPFTGHTGAVRAVAVGELAGRPVVMAGGGSSVRVWDLASGAPVSILTGYISGVLSVAAAELDGRPVIFTGSDDGSVRAWDMASGTPARNKLGSLIVLRAGGPVRALAVAELNGRPVLIFSGGRLVRVWDLARKKIVRRRLRPLNLRHKTIVQATALADRQDGVTVITGGSDGCCRTWDLATRRLLSGTAIPGGSGVRAVARLAPDRILCASDITLSVYAQDPGADPVLMITLDAEIQAVVTHGTALLAATGLGLVALDVAP